MCLGRARARLCFAGTLLTVDEAAQWVLHAAQLPQEVADAFVNNMVTGYDFPELAARQVGREKRGAGESSSVSNGRVGKSSRRCRPRARVPCFDAHTPSAVVVLLMF